MKHEPIGNARQIRNPATDASHDYIAAQSNAFGLVFVILSFIVALAMVATKRPAQMERAMCLVVGFLADWRTWAVITVLLILVALVSALLTC